MKTTAAGTKSGFEVLPRIVREEHPITDSTDHGLRFAFQQHVFPKRATGAETMRLSKVMDTKMSEHRDKSGKEFDEILKTSVIHRAMDTESGRKIRRSRVALKYDNL